VLGRGLLQRAAEGIFKNDETVLCIDCELFICFYAMVKTHIIVHQIILKRSV
jgi:hypothetical protein